MHHIQHRAITHTHIYRLITYLQVQSSSLRFFSSWGDVKFCYVSFRFIFSFFQLLRSRVNHRGFQINQGRSVRLLTDLPCLVPNSTGPLNWAAGTPPPGSSFSSNKQQLTLEISHLSLSSTISNWAPHSPSPWSPHHSINTIKIKTRTTLQNASSTLVPLPSSFNYPKINLKRQPKNHQTWPNPGPIILHLQP